MKTDNLKIAVLSGKGGAGKTLVSVNLAAVAKNSTYIDCDVEEPNGYLFFKPENVVKKDVTVKIPVVDDELCNGCRKCVKFCRYNALAYIKNKVVVYDQICHSCGGCMLVCPHGAISEKDRTIGKIESGTSKDTQIYTGVLNIGEVSGVPIIKEMVESKFDGLTIIDSPPGSACIVMESIKDANYCILVAEPTIFGVHNLEMIHELVKVFGKKFGVIINKSLDSDELVESFCKENGVKILGKIPFDKELGELNSDAKIAVRESVKYKELFLNLLDKVLKEAS
ncbi:MAG: 4Fe-4S binding protein [Campylobacteraceae bacterium]|nr:4Fe-4S binding protein [Campylobacteraceae bacterium]